MASAGSPLGAAAAALPFYPNFLQQLARFQNQAQLSSLLQNNKRATPPPPPPPPAVAAPPTSMGGHFSVQSPVNVRDPASLLKTEKDIMEDNKSFDVNRNKSNGTPELNNDNKAEVNNKTPLDLSLTTGNKQDDDDDPVKTEDSDDENHDTKL